MSGKAFANELAHALARPDVDDLRTILAVHHRASMKDESEWSDECGTVIASGLDDPDKALALITLASASFDDPEYLALMAAGPLEDILRRPDPQLLGRIVDEARRTPRFRWMLSGVWLHAVHPDCRDAVTGAVGDMSMDNGDQLPERPWA